MAIETRNLSSSDYEDGRYALIQMLEGYKTTEFYLDDKGLVTIGVGFNLNDPSVRNLVLSDLYQLQEVLYGPGSAAYIAEIHNVLSAQYSSDPAQQELDERFIRQELNTILQAWRDAYNAEWDLPISERTGDFIKYPPGISIKSYPGLNIDETVRVFFETHFVQEYEDKLNTNISGIPYSYERLALLSLAYNQTDGDTALIGPKLKQAIALGDRAEAWYEIRYNSGNQYKRRYVESELFGLWGDSEINEVSVTKALQMYTRHRDDILTHDSLTAYHRNLAAGDLALLNSRTNGLFTGLSAAPIQQELVHARQWIANFGLGEHTLDLVDELGSTGFSEYQIGDFGDNPDDVLGGSAAHPLISGWLMGLSGDDRLNGGSSTDWLFGGTGDDRLYGNDGEDYLSGGDNADHLFGGSYADVLDGGSGEDLLDGGGGDDHLVGGGGLDTYRFGLGFGKDTIIDLPGDSIILDLTAFSSQEVSFNTQNQTKVIVTFSNSTDSITINAPNLSIHSVLYSDKVASGDDTAKVEGSDANDNLFALGFANAKVFGLGGNDQIAGSASNSILDGGAGNDRINGYSGNDTLIAGGGKDYLWGGSGDDVYMLATSSQSYDEIKNGTLNLVQIAESRPSVQGSPFDIDPSLSYGIDTLDLSVVLYSDLSFERNAFDLFVKEKSGAFTVQLLNYYTPEFNHVEHLKTSDTEADLFDLSLQVEYQGGNYNLGDEADYFFADSNNGPALINAGAGNNYIELRNASNTIITGTGNDTITGRVANLVSSGAGNDRINLVDSPSNRSLDNFYSVSGDDGDDLIRFSSRAIENVSLNGGAGHDVLEITIASGIIEIDGGAGNDYFLINNNYQPVISEIMLDNKIVFKGSFGNDVIDSFSSLPVLVFSDISSTLDLQFSRTGNDAKISSELDESSVVIKDYFLLSTELRSLANISLGSQSFLLDGFLSSAPVISPAEGDYRTIHGRLFEPSEVFGSDSNEKMIAHASSVTFHGGAGNDYLLGGEGSDVLHGDSGSDLLFGGAGNDQIYGGEGGDIFDGGDGSDDLHGGLGDDTFIVDSDDQVFEDSNGGIDQVNSATSYSLGNNLENLLLLGSASINGDGNALNNVLFGNEASNTLSGLDGDDVLDGRGGADTLIGGTGNDTYVVDDDDNVIEYEWGGIDLVKVNISHVLIDNIENLQLLGTAEINGTGNSLDNYLGGNSATNTLIGGDGNDVLDGASGADVLIGGMGSDNYFIDNLGDQIIEYFDEGSDQVYANISFTLGDNLENLNLLGDSAINATGNHLHNAISGNSASNILDGGDGYDWLAGGAGDDSYFVDSIHDFVFEYEGDGIDTVNSSVNYSLSNNVENLILTGLSLIGSGNELDNILRGNAGNNILDGGSGLDVMFGEAGDDVYIVDNQGDVVIEGEGAGTDTVHAMVSFTLNDNLENLVLLDTANDGSGNSLDNIINGNGADNYLDGGVGADTLIGGQGNDTYVVDEVNDIIVEFADEGQDTVKTILSYELTENLENIVLTGYGEVDATGNALSNSLIGNESSNNLIGMSGNDYLVGGAGDDYLFGGSGDDFYVMGRGFGADTIVENSSDSDDFDIIHFDGDIAADQLWFSHVEDDLQVNIVGTDDKLVIDGWYSASPAQLDRIQVEGSYLLNSRVDALVAAMAAFNPPVGVGSSMSQEVRDQILPVISANWQTSGGMS